MLMILISLSYLLTFIKIMHENEPVIKKAHISKLKLDPKNARERTELSSGVIKKSLTEFGACRSIVIDENDVIRAGNGTFKEAGEVGIENVLVVEADGKTIVAVKRKGLTEEQWAQYAVADNTASDFSTWDIETLQEISNEYDITAFFPNEEIEKVMGNFTNTDSFFDDSGDSDDESGQDDSQRETSSKEIDVDNFEFECTCPKCGFHFNK